MDTNDKHKNVSSKMSKHSIQLLERIAEKKGMTKYQLIQMVCDTLIRYMDDAHNMSAEMERAMSMFEHMVGWADALNLADATVQKEIAEAVYILQDAEGKKKGNRVVMVRKPWMGDWEETANVMTIFERIFNVCMPELYMKLYRAKVLLDCESVTEVINLLCDAEVVEEMNAEYRREFEDASRAENGREYKYSARTKGKYHRTPDSVAVDQRLKFEDDIDRDDIEPIELLDWEGEWHDRGD